MDHSIRPGTASAEMSAEGLAFLQERVARVGIYGAATGFAFLCYRVVQMVIQDQYELTSLSFSFHILGVASLLAMGVVCRRGQRSLGVIRTTEILGSLAACTFYSLMGLHIPAWIMPHYIVLLALTLGLVTRAIYVPSTAGRSLMVTAVCGLPLLVMTYLRYHDLDVSLYVPFDAKLAGVSAVNIALWQTATVAMWWGAVVAICAGGSHALYGLRRQVRNVRRLGQYELVAKLGEGGMGVVYRARHAMLRRPTAVKLLPLHKAGATSIARFEKEVQLTARLSHPNTVTIFDYGRTPDGVFYYAMEYLQGATVQKIVDVTGPQPEARVVHLMAAVADALEEAHRIGLIHRDIKPANIMLVEQGGIPDVPKVLDFGLVKEMSRETRGSLTLEDTITGTPQYLSPEAILSPDDVDARSDLYALGAVGYYMLAGDHVFSARTIVELCSKHLQVPPEPLAQRVDRKLSPALADLILSCLAKHPEDRPPSAAALAERLRSIADVGVWREGDARRWWDDHGAEIHARGPAESTAGLTMDIDSQRLAMPEPSGIGS